MDDLLLHPSTRQALTAALAGHPHGLLLIGPAGSGKGTLASRLVALALEIPESSVAQHPYVKRIVPDNNSITIEQVRDIQKFLQLKTTGRQRTRRAVIIEQAQAMGVEAQNALLKTLEEPPDDTILILTSEGDRQLRATIHSRLQTIRLARPGDESAMDYFTSQGHEKNDVLQAFRLTGGLPGLMAGMLAGGWDQPAVQAVQRAKQLLGGTRYDRLAGVEALAKDKTQTGHLLEALVRIARAAIQQAARQGNSRSVLRWRSILAAAHAAQAALRRNANAKLVLTDLFLHL